MFTHPDPSRQFFVEVDASDFGVGDILSEFVSAGDVCAHSKSSHLPAIGLLLPLPVPSRPWSHIAVDFVTGLPPSEGNTVILTTIDRFSKVVHFVPLAKLMSASETANVLVQQVFRLHGITIDSVSDQGPQFSSQVWKAFCRANWCLCKPYIRFPSTV